MEKQARLSRKQKHDEVHQKSKIRCWVFHNTCWQVDCVQSFGRRLRMYFELVN